MLQLSGLPSNVRQEQTQSGSLGPSAWADPGAPARTNPAATIANGRRPLLASSSREHKIIFKFPPTLALRSDSQTATQAYNTLMKLYEKQGQVTLGHAAELGLTAVWTAPGLADNSQPHAAALSNASGLTSPRWLWRRLVTPWLGGRAARPSCDRRPQRPQPRLISISMRRSTAGFSSW